MAFKVLEFHSSIYPCPNSMYARKEMRSHVNTRIADLEVVGHLTLAVLSRTEEFRSSVLTGAAAQLREWSTRVRSIKAIYYTLNLCDIDMTPKLIVAEIWCLVSDLSSVHAALIKGLEQSGSSLCPVLNRIQTQQTPPTFNRNNCFTSAFQSVVDAYGVGKYQEINPAPYTTVTFPFLFAVMFGDCGHGVVMSSLALWLILQEHSFRKLQNEVWNVATNKLSFLNPYKMKMSVILGVVHMLFGVLLSLLNWIFFQKHQDIMLQFVPELIFMLSLFGYLMFLILYKWCAPMPSESAPSILLFINMMLFDYSSPNALLFKDQKPLQIFLVVLALLMVPWLLLLKPLLLYREHTLSQRVENTHLWGTCFFYQAIHTIEYCLGCISNTASYLRLWALSLAHAGLNSRTSSTCAQVSSSLHFLLSASSIYSDWQIHTHSFV
ncbi:LOW QUALITY PROTEIN: V-type proton ATPase 116 kDa subunit a 1-like [Osmerus eperlanus]|uniref:LOW QUALITY PROTEIN: V-type proton ATPase 116 kDa subunit a 1-like n=1 Tax=Osmerus eperlanus TaxID=29151 RepID=UPI002E0F83C5